MGRGRKKMYEGCALCQNCVYPDCTKPLNLFIESSTRNKPPEPERRAQDKTQGKKREVKKMKPRGSKTLRTYYEEYVRALPNAKRLNEIAEHMRRCRKNKPKQKYVQKQEKKRKSDFL